MLFWILAAAAVSTPVVAQPQLQPLATFVGHCFAGDAPANGGVDTHCFESVYGGQHVRDHHVVRQGGKEVYWGETLYSAERGLISFTYWNSLGGLGRGTVSAHGEILALVGLIHATPQAREIPLAADWRKIGGGYEVREADAGQARLFRRVD